MIKSMTGFGKAVAEIPGKKIVAELRSLNSKSMDLSLRMPYLYKEKELELRGSIAKQLERGKVDFTVYTESLAESLPVNFNAELAKSYYKTLKNFSSDVGEENPDLLAIVMKMPEVMKAEKEVVELSDFEWKEVQKTVDAAILAFQQFRDDEGMVLEKEFRQRVTHIDELLKDVISKDAQRVESIKSRIKSNIEDVVEKEKIDKNRFEQELIYYIEKLDITEEKLRLKTHLDYFIITMNETSCGRKLGFIAQEIGREINTIGSKANDAGIQKLVVQMKDELEKIKEQLLNVL